MTECERDEIDLRICALMDTPPFGEGRTSGEALKILQKEYPHLPLGRGALGARWFRVRKAIEAE